MRAQRKTTQSEPDNVLHIFPAQPRRKRQNALLKQLSAHLDKLRAWIDQEATPAERALALRRLSELADRLKEAHPKHFPEKPPMA